ncbi:MAG: response regulator [Bacteroidetes bacterium]|nr:response regulator [Bacteroidota bacterium]
MEDRIRLLYLEDNLQDVELMRAVLRREGLNADLKHVESAGEYLKEIQGHWYDVILSDYDLPSYSGEMAFHAARAEAPLTPFIIVTGALLEEKAIELIRNGVTDYVMKNHLSRLVPAVQRAIDEAKEKKLAETSLHLLAENERKLKLLVNNLPGIAYRCRYDRDWTMEYMSEGCFGLTGYQAGEIIHNALVTYNNIIHPDDRLKIWEEVEQAMEMQQPYTLEYRILTRLGEIKWVWEKGNSHLDETGQIESLEGLIIDITTQKKFEHELSKSEAQFKAIFESTKDAIVLFRDGKIFQANPAFKELHGYAANEDISHILTYDLVANEEKERVMSYQKKRLQGIKAPSFYETLGLKKDGTTFPIDVNVSPIILDDETYAVSIIRDISERKKQEKEIRLNESRLESLLRISQFKADSLQELLDYALDQAVKLTCSKMGYLMDYNELTLEFSPNTLSKEVKALCLLPKLTNSLLLQDTGLWGEVVRQRRPVINNSFSEPHPLKKGFPPGHAPILKFMSLPVFLDQDIMAVVGVANKEEDYNEADIRQLTLLMDTVWKIYERAKNTSFLNKAKEEAEQISQIKSNILKNLNHEFRTPMNSILGFADLLSRSLTKTEDLHMAGIIHLSAIRLMDTLNSLINLAELESGEFLINLKVIPVIQLIRHSVGKFSDQAKQKNLLILFDDPPECYVLADPLALQIVFDKVIGNAVKFTNTGSVTISVDKLCEKHSDWIEVKITDTGIGIPEDQMKMIFEAFYQISEGYSRAFEGSGLGLALSKKLINMMNGEIFFSSNHASGSVFTIRIPPGTLVVTEPSRLKTKNAGVTAGTLPGMGILPEILLVEDNPLNKELVCIYLRGKASIDHASSGETALNMARNKQYDIVLMDINLGPGINGLQVTKKIREWEGYKNTPIVAVTGYTSETDKRRLLDGGCSQYLPKPFSKIQLLETYQIVLSSLQ